MPSLKLILWPLSLNYQVVVYVRNKLYDWGWLKSVTPKVKTVVVGNLSVGGSGKTPMIEFLLRHWKYSDQLAVLSRGYGRKTKGFRILSEQDNAQTAGDEPFQLYSLFKERAIFAVCANRVQAIERLRSVYPLDTILLDDAFQHRKISATKNILLTPYVPIFYEDHYLPLGTLRDHKNQVKRAHLVVVTKCPKTFTSSEATLIEQKIQRRHNVPVFFTCNTYNETFLDELSASKDLRIALITGLANGDRLYNDLIERGVALTFFKKPDHYHYKKKDLEVLRTFDLVLTTTKDHSKLRPIWSDHLPPCKVVEVEHQFLFDRKEAFLELLAE
jgi:tetraacyldisaccharide 4'-kinase